MDPNANLIEQRNLATRLLSKFDRSAEEIKDDAIRLAELVLDLDQWLTIGGLKPQSWTR